MSSTRATLLIAAAMAVALVAAAAGMGAYIAVRQNASTPDAAGELPASEGRMAAAVHGIAPEVVADRPDPAPGVAVETTEQIVEPPAEGVLRRHGSAERRGVAHAAVVGAGTSAGTGAAAARHGRAGCGAQSPRCPARGGAPAGAAGSRAADAAGNRAAGAGGRAARAGTEPAAGDRTRRTGRTASAGAREP